jgi:P27 family predicted phage terminase small subunit
MPTPKPRPTKMKLLEGNPGRRPLPEGEPMPAVAFNVPDPPSHLTISAKLEWVNISDKLHRIGLLTEIDCAALALYCQAYGRWVDAEAAMIQGGMVVVTSNGNPIHNPYLGIANTAMRDCHTYLTEFGMTPSSRSKVTAAEPEKKSKFYGLIQGGEKVANS